MPRALIDENDVDAGAHYPNVTREPFRNRGATTDLVKSEWLFADIDPPRLKIDTDRATWRGSPATLNDLRQTFLWRGFGEGSRGDPDHFISESRSSSAEGILQVPFLSASVPRRRG